MSCRSEADTSAGLQPGSRFRRARSAWLCLPAESERLATQLARDLAGGSERHGYKVRAFRVGGKTVAGFAAFRNHLSYLPFSGSVLPQLDDELKGYTRTKSALHFPVDRPLAKTLVTKLIGTRLPEIGTK